MHTTFDVLFIHTAFNAGIKSMRMPIVLPSHTMVSREGPQIGQIKNSSIGTLIRIS